MAYKIQREGKLFARYSVAFPGLFSMSGLLIYNPPRRKSSFCVIESLSFLHISIEGGSADEGCLC